MKIWGIAAVLMVALAGCGGDAGDQTAVTPQAAPSFPQPGATALDATKPPAPAVGDANPVCGKAEDGYLPCRAIASLSAANGGLAADAPTVARWGYQLYGSRVIPAPMVSEMIKGDGEYGLGTMLFTQRFGIGTAVGHRGVMPDYTSLLVVIPEKKLSVALLLADGNKQIDTAMTDLIAAIQPLVT